MAALLVNEKVGLMVVYLVTELAGKKAVGKAALTAVTTVNEKAGP